MTFQVLVLLLLTLLLMWFVGLLVYNYFMSIHCDEVNDVHQFGFKRRNSTGACTFVLKVLATIMSKMVAMLSVVLLTLLRHSTT